MSSFGESPKTRIEEELRYIFETDYDSESSSLWEAKNSNPKIVLKFAADVAEVMEYLLAID